MNTKTAKFRRRLEELGHLSVLENISVGREIQREVLGPKSLKCFGALHQIDLEKTLAATTRFDAGSATADTLALQGRVQWLLGRRLPARRDLEKALVLAPNHAEALGYLGVCGMQHSPRQAIFYFKKASRAADFWAWPHLWSAAARIRLSTKAQFNQALEDLDRFRKLLKREDELALLLESFSYLNLRDYRQAVDRAERLIKKNPAAGAGFGLRSLARLALRDEEGAFADHNSSRDREPSGGFDIVDILSLGEGHWKSAKQYLEMLDVAVKKYPRRACFRIRRAEVLRGPEFFRYDLALEDYREAEIIEPRRAWILAHIGRAEGELLGPEKSLRRLDRAVALFPAGGWIYAWRGQVRKILGQSSLALKDFNLAAEKMPWYAYSYVWKGALLASSRRWRQAWRCLDMGLSLGPTYPSNALAYFSRSLCARACSMTDRAVEDVTAAFLIDSKYEWAGTSAEPATRGECLGAIAQLSGLLRREPNNSWALVWRGRAYFKIGRLHSANRDFSRALILEPRNAWAYQWRGLANKESDRDKEAREDFKAALRVDSEFWPAAVELAGLCVSQGRLEQAIRILSQHESNPKRSTSFFTLRGGIFLQWGKAARSVRDLKRAILLNPSNARAHDLLARACLKEKKYQAALDAANTALRLNPDLVTALMSRGIARGALGDGHGQIEDFRRAHGLDPTLFRDAGEAVLSILSRKT